MSKKILAQSLSLSNILKATAEPKSLLIFQYIASESLDSYVLIKKMKLTPKQYYSRLSLITNAGLVNRKNKKYYPTSLGKVVYGLQVTVQKALDNYWRLKAIDSFNDISKQEKELLTKQLIDEKDVTELLIKEYSAPIEDRLIDSGTNVDRQTKDRSSLNLMLVEDDPDTALTLKTILTSQGYNVEAFTDSFEALKHFIKLNRPYYELVISDVRMPRMNGVQLYQKLKSIDQGVKIIFLTALDAADELASILPDMKKSNIIRKPISTENFINVIEKALNSPHPVSYVHKNHS
jgi:CheY-like chemotaxis protein